MSLAEKDSVNKDSITVSSKKLIPTNDVETTVNYHATDSIIMDVKKKKAYLYGKAHVDYGDINLDAEYIEIDWNKSEIFAKGYPDSTGKIVGHPVFKENEDMYTAKEMRYNFKTKKGIISEVVTQEGEGYIHGEKVKIDENKNLYVSEAQYTTCNMEHPHFAIHSEKIKVVPEKVAVTGPFHISIADIPMPAGFLFGIFPIPKEKTSGIIIPSPGYTDSRGFFLKDGGVYVAVNDYLGVTAKGDFYANGSWRLGLENQYKVKYAYEGNMFIAFSSNKSGFDFIERSLRRGGRGYKFTWQHKPSTQGNSSFVTNVNMQSSNYNVDNSFNPNQIINNSFVSSISYSKKFGKTPFNLNTTLNQNQTDSIQYFTLPNSTFSMNRQQPFKALKIGKSNSWYKQIGIQYSSNLRADVNNRIEKVNFETGRTVTRVEDLDFLTPESIFRRANMGIKHQIPVTTTIKVFKYININPSFNYNEYWYPQKLSYTFIDSLNRALVTDTLKGFYRLREHSTNLSVATNIYGFFKIGALGIDKIRHHMMPTVGLTYKPDFAGEGRGVNQFFTDTLGFVRPYNSFNRFAVSSPSFGEQRTLSFGLNNIFEAKAKIKENDTLAEAKKIKLLDNFGITTSYNFAADSLNFSPLAMNARTTFKGIIMNISSSHDFYAFDSLRDGKVDKINQFYWEKSQGKLLRLTNYSVNFSTSLNPQKRKKEKEYNVTDERDAAMVDYIIQNPDRFVDFSIPWNLNVSLNLTWNKVFFNAPVIGRVAQFSGDFSLTPKWKISGSTSYDMVKKQMTATRFRLIRDLHCWEFSVEWIPLGMSKSYTFNIGVKPGVLQDLKLSKVDRSIDR